MESGRWHNHLLVKLFISFSLPIPFSFYILLFPFFRFSLPFPVSLVISVSFLFSFPSLSFLCLFLSFSFNPEPKSITDVSTWRNWPASIMTMGHQHHLHYTCCSVEDEILSTTPVCLQTCQNENVDQETVGKRETTRGKRDTRTKARPTQTRNYLIATTQPSNTRAETEWTLCSHYFFLQRLESVGTCGTIQSVKSIDRRSNWPDSKLEWSDGKLVWHQLNCLLKLVRRSDINSPWIVLMCIETKGLNQRRISWCQVLHDDSQTVPQEIDGLVMLRNL